MFERDEVKFGFVVILVVVGAVALGTSLSSRESESMDKWVHDRRAHEASEANAAREHELRVIAAQRGRVCTDAPKAAP